MLFDSTATTITRTREAGTGRLMFVLTDAYGQHVADAILRPAQWDTGLHDRVYRRSWAELNLTFVARDAARTLAHARFLTRVARAQHLFDLLVEIVTRDDNAVRQSLRDMGYDGNPTRTLTWKV